MDGLEGDAELGQGGAGGAAGGAQPDLGGAIGAAGAANARLTSTLVRGVAVK